MKLVVTGFDPQEREHQIIGSGNQAGGFLIVSTGGNKNLNTYANATGQKSQSECTISTLVQNDLIKGHIKCSTLFNSNKVTKDLIGEFACRYSRTTM